ncbi:AAA family ATPase [Xanthobacter oligotrophicus]|uniref:AAA family ATPase n=1 Tax=Xanthobacter oligotrophicus TaxID=2607286 RepID=UPI0011F20DD6|nr:ATP-binding protein [Xanthobacter oligotrophicus]MCG5235131.1 ATP-binding protein [Xanthobacter oligotrophicus]
MKLIVERLVVESLVEAFPDQAHLLAQPRLSTRMELGLDTLKPDELAHLHDLVLKNGGTAVRGQEEQLANLVGVFKDEGQRFAPEELEDLAGALALYFVNASIRGWLFRMNSGGKPEPYLITRLDYTPPGEEEAGRIIIELKANNRGKTHVENLLIRSKDLRGLTIPGTLAAKGWLMEDAGLLASFDDQLVRYFEWRGRYGHQFSGKGTGIFAEDPTANRRDTDWSRKSVIVLSSSGSEARLVNDEELLGERTLGNETSGFFLDKIVKKADKQNLFHMAVDEALKAAQANVRKGSFTDMPVHPLILMFHLELHHHVWVHVDDITPYQYHPELKQKLVLPPEQTDLIDILTAEMNTLMDDVVAGKSGGTTVLCAGPPGVGKTLTAEVYSEIIQRPLYRVHSGQLGLDVAHMEQALKDALTRAQRWGAVMLIDEADVYIKRRQDNLTMNAVVGVFLRVLEYFNGLLFLTTNRVDDIDEAIISRCIALIKYHSPGPEDRRKIWRVMADQFGLPLSDELIGKLVVMFPETSGRDIKGLAKLVAKYCSQKNEPPTIDAFRRCAIFRALDVPPVEAA